MADIQKVVVIDSKMTPIERMVALGLQNQKIMDARVKAYRAGMTVIHNELCKLSTQNEQEQRDLLTAHPELMLWAVSK